MPETKKNTDVMDMPCSYYCYWNRDEQYQYLCFTSQKRNFEVQAETTGLTGVEWN